ncbi:MAG: TIR domain-containing protein [Dehalococcoidia bacterium]
MGKKRVFVAGRYGPSFEFALEAVTEAARKAATVLGTDIELVRPDQLRIGSSVVDAIRDWISQADLIVADLSGASPNVMWEAGFAQALGKSVLLLSEDIGHVPFDLRDRQILLYQPHALISSFVARLTDALVDILREPSKKALGHSATGQPRRRRVFISYSHEDYAFLHRILVHLRPLERDGHLDLWSDTNIKAGDRWRDEIRRALNSARLAVLLISADFLASDFIVTNELPPLLSAAEEKGARIIPVIVKPSRFLRDDNLARFQALNDPKQPLVRMNEADREDLYARLAETIEVELDIDRSGASDA